MSSTRRCASSPTRPASNSIAGIMGGEASGCTEATTDVLIELALWEPLNIAQTGRKLGIQLRRPPPLRARRRSGLHAARPRTRHPRWSSTSAAARPSEIAVAGEVPAAAADHRLPGDRGEAPRAASIRRSATSSRSSSVSASPARRRSRQGAITVTVPTWRPDVTLKADLVEEVVRIIGVDNVPPAPLPRAPGVGEAGADARSRPARAAPSGRWPRAGWSRR